MHELKCFSRLENSDKKVSRERSEAKYVQMMRHSANRQEKVRTALKSVFF